mgnify:CR=1 FL=1
MTDAISEAILSTTPEEVAVYTDEVVAGAVAFAQAEAKRRPIAPEMLLRLAAKEAVSVALGLKEPEAVQVVEASDHAKLIDKITTISRGAK